MTRRDLGLVAAVVLVAFGAAAIGLTASVTLAVGIGAMALGFGAGLIWWLTAEIDDGSQG